ncbi:Z1 domain-containing protein [Bacillus mycoides]|uniref:Z1 domain-containing protein n=2 Tax=Bacillus mycoides TaxID=1405 RepID=UPI002852937E|nr:Z1 domain-containing protein [Bacillus mycoides]
MICSRSTRKLFGCWKRSLNIMSNEIVAAIEDLASIMLPKDNLEEITEEQIKQTVQTIIPIAQIKFGGIHISQMDIDAAIVNIEERYAITMDTGTLLKEDNYKKWYYNSKADRGTEYWDRYSRYLVNDVNLPQIVINKIDEASEDIMDVLGDPLSKTDFQRKGLIIGSVQSGKTSNYTALINKAADSGYKVIILLTGTIEKLRKQTQGRIDEGFVGMDSRNFIEFKKLNKRNAYLGAGKYNNKINVASFTTTEKDFDLKGLNMRLSSVADPVIFVIKKNKSILEKLHNWLKGKNADQSTGMIDFPMLLIDDEADNASVNTNDPDKDPTAINNGIRDLLKLFRKYSYVGFTATPFANIFIDPQLEVETKNDLFPKDFIYLLEQPSNYVGPMEMYSENGQYHYMIRYNDDMENILELKHKNGTKIPTLPESLKTSILLFLLANAVRDLRGQEKKHRSMLIHVSRFISVQKFVQEQVKNYFNFAKERIKNYALSETEEPFIKELHDLFDKEFGKENYAIYGDEPFNKKEIEENWDDVKQVLYKAISPIQVHTVNSGSASQRMNYDEYEDGLRLIAIGGLSLARGLTLEGLTISYFYRNTKMYDTLMQMGRWFGYRDGYSDLCRLWTSSESAGWYEHIAEATEELRNEIKRMSRENKRPIDFGLRVRSAEDIPLIVTARNKMRHSEQIKLVRQLNGRMIETAILPSKKEEIEANNNVIERWLVNNKRYLFKDVSKLGRQKPTFKDVPKEVIIDLLTLVEYPYMNEFSKDSILVGEIKKSASKIFDKWDVVVATNRTKKDEETKVFGEITIYPITRSFDFFGTGHYVRISKSKKRLGSTDYALAGLMKKEMELIENSVKNLLDGQKNKKGRQKAPTQNMYFNTGISRNPQIVIYPVQLSGTKGVDPEVDGYIDSLDDQLITGISIGIPDIQGVQSVTYEYVVNKVYQMELIEGSSSQFDWDEAYDEDDVDALDD